MFPVFLTCLFAFKFYVSISNRFEVPLYLGYGPWKRIAVSQYVSKKYSVIKMKEAKNKESKSEEDDDKGFGLLY